MKILFFSYFMIIVIVALILFRLRAVKHIENFINVNKNTCMIKNKSINMHVNEIKPLTTNLRNTWYYEYDNAYFNKVFKENCPITSRDTKTHIKTHELMKDKNTNLKGNVIIIFETWINGLKKLKFDDYNEKIKIVDLHIIKSTKFKSPIIFCIIMIHRKYKFHGKIIKALLNVDNQQVVFAHVTDNIIEYDVLAYEKLNSDNSNDNNLHLNGNEYYYKTSKDERITNDNVGSSCTDSYQNMINCNLKYSDMIYLNQSS